MEDYHAKYIKYKKKYLQLRKLQRGGNFEDLEQFYREAGCSSHQVNDETNKIFMESGNKSTYGEMTREGMKKMLEGTNNQGLVYYDLGSGLGKTVIYAVKDHGFAKGIGIELAKERYDNSVKVVKKLPNDIKDKIQLHNNSFLSNTFNFNNADVIFISSLCFPDSIMKDIATKLEKEARPGVRIYTSKPLISSKIMLKDKLKIKMTWDSNSTLHSYVVQ